MGLERKASLFLVSLFCVVSASLALLGPGEPCEFYRECDVDLICISPDNTCQRRSKLGGPCNISYDCIDNTHVCIEGKCGPPSDIGEPCTDIRDCKDGNPCIGGVCAEYASLDQSCDSYEDCDGVFCKGIDNGTPGVCSRLSYLNEPCSSNPICWGGTVCTFNETCQLVGGLGDPCNDRLDCDGVHICKDEVCCRNDGVCDPDYPLGMPCTADQNCTDPNRVLTCIGRKCAELSPLGGDCGSGHDCVDGNPCVEGKCVNFTTEGGFCNNIDECQNNACVESKCSRIFGPDEACFNGDPDWCRGNLFCLGQRCSPPSDESGPCNSSSEYLGECQTGLECVDNECCEPGRSCSSARRPTESPSSGPTDSGDGSGPSVGAIVGGVVGGIAGVSLIAVVVAFFVVRRRDSDRTGSVPNTATGTTGVTGQDSATAPHPESTNYTPFVVEEPVSTAPPPLGDAPPTVGIAQSDMYEVVPPTRNSEQPGPRNDELPF